MFDFPPRRLVVTPRCLVGQVDPKELVIALEDFLADVDELAIGGDLDPDDLLRRRHAHAYARVVASSCDPILYLPKLPEAVRGHATYSAWVEDAVLRLRWAGIPVIDCLPAVGVRTIAPTRLGLRAYRAGYGNPYPEVVFVAERAPRSPVDPLTGPDGAWLCSAWQHLGLDELSVFLAYCHGPTAARGANDALAAYLQALQVEALTRGGLPRPVVALDARAGAVLEAASLRYQQVCSPSWHRRFKRDHGPAGYARELQRVVYGHPRPLRTTYPTTEGPTLPKPLDAILTRASLCEAAA